MMTIDEVRAYVGCGLHDIKKGMELWPTDDPLLAAFSPYRDCVRLNINVSNFDGRQLGLPQPCVG